MTRPNKRAATLGQTYRKRQLDARLRTLRVRVRRHHDINAMIAAPFVRMAFGAGEVARAFDRMSAKVQATVRAMTAAREANR